MHRRVVIALAVAAVLAMGAWHSLAGTRGAHAFAAQSRPGIAPHSSIAGSSVQGQVLSLQQVDDLALKAAAYNGDAHPTDVEAVLTTRAAAGSVIFPGGAGQTDAASAAAYAITIHGVFTYDNWGGPAESTSAPTPGVQLTLVVDAQTGELMDANLRNAAQVKVHPVDLSGLGPVQALSP